MRYASVRYNLVEKSRNNCVFTLLHEGNFLNDTFSRIFTRRACIRVQIRAQNYSNGGWLIEQNVEQASYGRRFRQKHAMTEEIFKRAVGGGHYAYSDDVLGRRARRRDEESARRAYAADIAVTSQNNSVNAYKEPPDDSLHHTVPILLCAFDTLDSIRHKQTKASMKYNPFYEHMTR